MAAQTDIGTLIAQDPGVRGGRPIVAGTGVTVQSIVYRHTEGLTAEQIAESYGHLSVAQVYAALAYYYANQDEIDREMGRDEEAAGAAERFHSQSQRQANLPRA